MRRRPTSQVPFALNHQGIEEEKSQAFPAQSGQTWDIAARPGGAGRSQVWAGGFVVASAFRRPPRSRRGRSIETGTRRPCRCNGQPVRKYAGWAAVSSLDDVDVVRRVGCGSKRRTHASSSRPCRRRASASTVDIDSKSTISESWGTPCRRRASALTKTVI